MFKSDRTESMVDTMTTPEGTYLRDRYPEAIYDLHRSGWVFRGLLDHCDFGPIIVVERNGVRQVARIFSHVVAPTGLRSGAGLRNCIDSGPGWWVEEGFGCVDMFTILTNVDQTVDVPSFVVDITCAIETLENHGDASTNLIAPRSIAVGFDGVAGVIPPAFPPAWLADHATTGKGLSRYRRHFNPHSPSNVWTLGVLAWELVHQTAAFPHRTVEEWLDAVSTPLRWTHSTLVPELDTLLKACMERDAPSVRELHEVAALHVNRVRMQRFMRRRFPLRYDQARTLGVAT